MFSKEDKSGEKEKQKLIMLPETGIDQNETNELEQVLE
jgi:hypothetical protein